VTDLGRITLWFLRTIRKALRDGSTGVDLSSSGAVIPVLVATGRRLSVDSGIRWRILGWRPHVVVLKVAHVGRVATGDRCPQWAYDALHDCGAGDCGVPAAASRSCVYVDQTLFDVFVSGSTVRRNPAISASAQPQVRRHRRDRRDGVLPVFDVRHHGQPPVYLDDLARALAE